MPNSNGWNSGKNARYVRHNSTHSINSVRPEFGDTSKQNIHVRHTQTSSYNAKFDGGHKASYGSRRHAPSFSQYDTSALRQKKPKWPAVVAILVIIAILCGIYFGFKACTTEPDINPNLAVDGTQVTIEVKQGNSSRDIANTLYEKGLINKRADFENAVKSKGVGSELKAGTYTFTAGVSVDTIIDVIVSGATDSSKLTVPEGKTRAEIADLVQTTTGGRVTADDFLAASADASVWAGEFSFLESAGTNHLEGFLYPETYSLDASSTAEDIVRMMLTQFGTVWETFDLTYPNRYSFSAYDVVKFASIVEKEATTEYMPQVAGVIYNRIATSEEAPSLAYLECDSTTAYVVGHEPTAEEVHSDNEYSTYTHAGFPPTPICNPGLDAFTAVMKPVNDGSLYFLSYFDENNNTVMVFNSSLGAHEAAVEKYLK